MARVKSITIIDPDAQDTNQIDQPSEEGEQSAMGSAPDPSTDDDVEEMAATMGLYTKPHPDTSEDMTPLGMAEQVNQAERKRHGIDDNTFSDE